MSYDPTDVYHLAPEGLGWHLDQEWLAAVWRAYPWAATFTLLAPAWGFLAACVAVASALSGAPLWWLAATLAAGVAGVAALFALGDLAAEREGFYR